MPTDLPAHFATFSNAKSRTTFGIGGEVAFNLRRSLETPISRVRRNIS